MRTKTIANVTATDVTKREGYQKIEWSRRLKSTLSELWVFKNSTHNLPELFDYQILLNEVLLPPNVYAMRQSESKDRYIIGIDYGNLAVAAVLKERDNEIIMELWNAN
jgi:activator of 2-hydroxyglutaryl-CoA dehydratase